MFNSEGKQLAMRHWVRLVRFQVLKNLTWAIAEIDVDSMGNSRENSPEAGCDDSSDG